MRVKYLYLKNVRCYKEALFEFNPKWNLIYGCNARGKTTLLEAIYLLQHGKSFRTHQLTDLIKKGENACYIEALFVKHSIEHTLKIYIDPFQKKVVCNHSPYPSLTRVLGLISGSIFTPDDISLVKGAPNFRRQYIDIQLAQIDPLYVYHLNRYTKAMKSRNALLKAKDVRAISVFEWEMSRSAEYLINKRREGISSIEASSNRFFKQIGTSSHDLYITYDSSLSFSHDIATKMAEKLKENRAKELVYGATLIGPHKDELGISIDDKECRIFSSEGEQRTVAAAMRLAEWQYIANHTESEPIMMIDDVGISFDVGRKQNLIDTLNGLSQIFLTTTAKIELPSEQATYIEI